MKYEVEADILTDDWPNFKCTVIKLPMSQVIHYKLWSPQLMLANLFITFSSNVEMFTEVLDK